MAGGRPDEPSPPPAGREVLGAAGILLVLLALLFHDVVFLNRTLLTFFLPRGVMGEAPPWGYPGPPREPNLFVLDPLASLSISEPAARKASQLLWRGEAPLWDSSTSLGRPLLASADTSVPNPVRLPLELWPWPLMWDAFLLGRLLVAGLFAYLLARRLGLGPRGSMTAGLGYAFSGYFLLYINHPHADFAMITPVVLHALELLAERASPGRLAYAAAALALGIVSNNPQASVIVLMFAVAYYLARAFVVSRGEGRPGYWATVGPFAVALALGVGLTGYALVPMVELIGVPGTGGLVETRHTVEAAHGLRYDRPEHLVTLLVPYLKGPPQQSFVDGGWSGVRNYVGVVVALLAVVGLFARAPIRRFGWIFLGAGAFFLAKTYGMPLVNWVGALPVLNLVAFAPYSGPVIAVSLVVLAGIGVDRVARGRVTSRDVGIGVAAVVVGLAVLLWLNRGALPSVPPQVVMAQLALAAALVLATGGVALAVARGRLGGRAGAGVLVGLVALELFAFTLPLKDDAGRVLQAVFRGEGVGFVRRPDRHDPLTEPPYVRFLRDRPGVFRVVGVDHLLYPNTASAFDLDDVRGLTATSLSRYLAYVQAFVTTETGHRFTDLPSTSVAPGQPRSLAGNPMFDLLNVRYLVARADRPFPSGTEDQFRLVYDDEVKVYENLHAFPRAFLVHRAVTAASPEEALELLRRPGFDPASEAVVEGEVPPALLAAASPSPTRDSVRVTRHEDHRVEIEASTDAPGLLVLSDSHYPGWRAYVDGEERPILPTDLALRGVYLEAGDHTVRFAYAPRSFRLGVLLTLLSAGVLGAWPLATRLRRRRASRQGSEATVDPGAG